MTQDTAQDMTQEEPKKLTLAEKHELAKKQIGDLLANYVDGWNVFKRPDDWETNIELTPLGEASDPREVPRDWLGIAEKVCGIIAKTKYGLDTYDNVIEVIDAEQMLMAYSSIGMPVNYEHWSFGLQMIQEKKKYDKGEMGLAYEIVINTNPSIAYCMGDNTKMMQILVIAHASFGHNSFFKGNHLFKQFTDPDTIIAQMKRLRESQLKYEEKFGIEEVTAVFDAAHALRNLGVKRYTPPPRPTVAQMEERKKALDEARRVSYDDVLANTIKMAKGDFEKSAKTTHQDHEENILRYIADTGPHLEPWKRDILHQLSDLYQYFYPQGQTQVMNEGWASFWHHKIINDLFDMDLIDDGMMLEFIKSHTSVVFQPEMDSRYYSGINPYHLGFSIYTDIKRICENPTDEDREYFPDWAGNPDWVSVLKDAMESCKDESFISQYLSPRVMRDLKHMAILDDDKNENLIVDAIHDEEGYRRLRRHLSAQYNMGERNPNIEVAGYDYRGDRSLVLKHAIHNRKPLDEKDTQETLKHIYRLWGHPVLLYSVDPDDSVQNTMSCPRDFHTSEDKKDLYKKFINSGINSMVRFSFSQMPDGQWDSDLDPKVFVPSCNVP